MKNSNKLFFKKNTITKFNSEISNRNLPQKSFTDFLSITQTGRP
jgi:hypothetical protein